MIRLRHKLFSHLLRVFDVVVLLVALAGVMLLGQDGVEGEPFRRFLRGYFRTTDLIGLVGLSLGWFLLFNALVHYETNRLKSLHSQIIDVIKATTAAAFLLLIIDALVTYERLTQEVVVAFWVVTTLICIVSRLVLRWLLMAVRRSGYNFRHVMILGFNENAMAMARRIDANQVLGYKIVGFIAEEEGAHSKSPHAVNNRILGTLKDLRTILERGPVDELILCVPFLNYVGKVAEAVQLASDLGIVVRFFPDHTGSKLLSQVHLERFEGDYVVTLFRETMLAQLFFKRLMDITLSLVALIVLSPLLIGIALAIKFTSPGPVLFKQVRVGMNKRRFKLLKFRSMYIDAEKRKAELAHLNEMDGPVFKIKNDPRVTPIGRFIRKTSIDELPQLWNVFVGEMSLVGPRPPLFEEVDQYDWLYRRRLSIKPGITCLWQISGRNEITFKQWMEMDKEYIDTWTLWLDIKILLKTIPAVLLRKGAS